MGGQVAGRRVSDRESGGRLAYAARPGAARCADRQPGAHLSLDAADHVLKLAAHAAGHAEVRIAGGGEGMCA